MLIYVFFKRHLAYLKSLGDLGLYKVCIPSTLAKLFSVLVLLSTKKAVPHSF